MYRMLDVVVYAAFLPLDVLGCVKLPVRAGLKIDLVTAVCWVGGFVFSSCHAPGHCVVVVYDTMLSLCFKCL